VGQRIERIDIENIESLRQCLDRGHGVIIMPNHSTHYDSNCLYEASDLVGKPFLMLTAWQVFAMSKPFDVWSLQWHGCFSVDRENNDVMAFRTAVDTLRNGVYPLMVFPEGDIYHTNDRVMPFREGAAAMALAAAKRTNRPISAIPCGIKFRYVSDPTPSLNAMMDRLERRLHWIPRTHLSLVDRVYGLAEGLLCLQELEFIGQPSTGPIPERIQRLLSSILDDVSMRAGLQTQGSPPERIKELRRHFIARRDREKLTDSERQTIERSMAHLFVATQLYSYPGDYVREKPSIERIAETIDKFEEDMLESEYPGIRGSRRVIIRFGEPIPVAPERNHRHQSSALSLQLQQAVQRLLDDINRDHGG
jgi:1-acyl-sn-glycerol-3-phosphate acyltransferase